MDFQKIINWKEISGYNFPYISYMKRKQIGFEIQTKSGLNGLPLSKYVSSKIINYKISNV